MVRLADITEQELLQDLDTEVQVQRMKVNGHELNYSLSGSGEPLLLIHGANFGWGMWYPNIPELSRSFQVCAVDLPGSGRSSKLDFRWVDWQKDYLETLVEFVERMEWKRFQIVGHSFGGWLAVKLARRFSEKVKALVLADSVGFSASAGPERMMGFYPLPWMLSKTVLRPKRSNKGLEGFLRSAFADDQTPVSDTFVEYFYETMHRSHGILLMSRLIRHRKQLLLGDELAELLQPVLVIWGEDDKIIPLQGSQPLFERIPQARVEIFPSCGHVPSLEQSEQFNELVIEFLEGIHT